MADFKKINDVRVAVIGLGYVGLPAVEFGRHLDTVGFDIDPQRIGSAEARPDPGSRRGRAACSAAPPVHDRAEKLRGCDVYTSPCRRRSIFRRSGRTLPRYVPPADRGPVSGGRGVYESTVYPGCTEEDCAPILGSCRLSSTRTSSATPRTHQSGRQGTPSDDDPQDHVGVHPGGGEFVDGLYGRITEAAPIPRRAFAGEAAKVINTQRRQHRADQRTGADLQPDGSDTLEVLQAAGTKWNFLPFRPGPSVATDRRRSVLSDARRRRSVTTPK